MHNVVHSPIPVFEPRDLYCAYILSPLSFCLRLCISCLIGPVPWHLWLVFIFFPFIASSCILYFYFIPFIHDIPWASPPSLLISGLSVSPWFVSRIFFVPEVPWGGVGTLISSTKFTSLTWKFHYFDLITDLEHRSTGDNSNIVLLVPNVKCIHAMLSYGKQPSHRALSMLVSLFSI